MIRHPDIVLLVLDTQRVDRLSCYGYPIETSPFLDALAAEATFFSHAVAPAQWTIPSHASMFTGLYPSQHMMFQQDSMLPTALPTLAERLQRAGYFTAGFSNNPLVGILNNGLGRGFDSFLNYGGLLTLHPKRQQGFMCLLSKLLSRIQTTMAHSKTVNRLLFLPMIFWLWRSALQFKGNLKGNTAQTLTNVAQLLIERQGTAPDQPLFCFINLMGTHIPYDPPGWAVKRFASHIQIDSATRLFLRRFNAHMYRGPLLNTLDPKCKALLDGLYNAEVAAQDAQIGIFLGHLRAAGRLKRTLLIVVADHGEHLGEKQLLSHNFSTYEELVHVPLLIRDPLGDLPRSATVTHFVSTRRLFHTVLTAARIATSSEEALTLAQADSDDPDRGIVFTEAEPVCSVARLIERRWPGLLRALDYDQSHRAVYSGKYKLIAAGQRHVELYAVRDDPTENVNLQQELPEVVERLREHLRGFMQRADGSARDMIQYDDDPVVRQRLKALGYSE